VQVTSEETNPTYYIPPQYQQSGTYMVAGIPPGETTLISPYNPNAYATLDVNAAAKYIENSYRLGAHAFRTTVTSIMRRSRCSAFRASSSPPGGSRKTVLLKMWILQPACPGLVNVAAT